MSRNNLNPGEYGGKFPYDRPDFPSNQEKNFFTNSSRSDLHSFQDNQSLFGSVKTGTQFDRQMNFDSSSQFTDFLNQEQSTNGKFSTIQSPAYLQDSSGNQPFQQNQFPWIGMENCSMMPGIQNPAYPTEYLDQGHRPQNIIINDPAQFDLKPPSYFTDLGDEIVFDLGASKTKADKNKSELLSSQERGKYSSTKATENSCKGQNSYQDPEDPNEIVLYSKAPQSRKNFQADNEKNRKNFQKELQNQMRIYAGKREKTWNEVYHNSVPGSPETSLVGYEPTKKMKTYSTCMPNSPRSEMYEHEQTGLPNYDFRDGPVSGINSVNVSGASILGKGSYGFNPNANDGTPSWMKAFIANDRSGNFEQRQVPGNSDQ
jgi:hypothetical protein